MYIEPSDLSTDQMYLFGICWLVSTGIVPESLEKRHPDNMSHARWLTTTNMLLRLFVARESQDENLLLQAKFILNMYAEMWFREKCKPQVQNGLVNLFLMLITRRDFDDSRISFVVILIAHPSFHSRKNHFFCIFFYWGPQDTVLVSSNFATTFKTVRIYELHLTQCLEISGIIYNIDNIRINLLKMY